MHHAVEENHETIAAIRRFNRFYTQKIGVLEEGLLKSPHSLTEVRVLFEIGNHETHTAAGLARELGLDPAQLSRTLVRLERQELITRERSDQDARERVVALTQEGRTALAELQRRAQEEVARMIEPLPPRERERLLQAMATVQEVLSDQVKGSAPLVLRTHEPGDLGWIVERHGVLYAREYGWDPRFEGLVARIASEFLESFDPRRERCWLAEIEGRRVGSVMCVQDQEQVARLRLLLVEPEARGLGLGARLVDECIRFARQAGYRRLVLWTNSVLEAAGRIYARAGFKMVEEKAHRLFGPELVGQTWELDLQERVTPRGAFFNQVNLVVRDFETTLAFYRRLGLEIGEGVAGHHVEIAMGARAHVAFDSPQLAKVYDPQGPAGPVLGVRLPSREAVDARYEELTAAGFQGRRPPHDAFWGSRYALVVDPEGRLVGLSSPPDPSHAQPPPEL